MAKELDSKSELVLALIKETSEKLNISSAVARSPLGELLSGLTVRLVDQNYPDNPVAQEAVIRASMQCFSLDTRIEGLHNPSRETRPEAPKFDGQFVAFEQLQPRDSSTKEYLDYDEDRVLQVIEELLSYTLRSSADNKAVYAPFFTDTKDPESQIAITGEIWGLKKDLEGDMKLLKEKGTAFKLKVRSKPQLGVVTNPTTRGKNLPTSLVGSLQRGDIETGRSDILLNTSFRRGDRVAVLATYEKYSLVCMKGAAGWVKTSDVGFISNDGRLASIKVDGNAEDNIEYFYVGRGPFFVEQKDVFSGHKTSQTVILPGDTVMANPRLEWFCLPRKHPEGTLSWTQVENTGFASLTAGFKTPQEFLDFIYHSRLPYVFGVFDCSEIIRRAFKVLGYDLPKYSADISVELAKLETQSVVATKEELNQVQDGLYIVFRPGHMYVVTVQKGKFEAFSQAFEIKGDSGETEYPIGPHVGHKEMLLGEIERGRQLTFSKIATTR